MGHSVNVLALCTMATNMVILTNASIIYWIKICADEKIFTAEHAETAEAKNIIVGFSLCAPAGA